MGSPFSAGIRVRPLITQKNIKTDKKNKKK